MIIQSVICLITDPIESPTPSPKGLIKLRIDPGAVEDLLSIASSLGKLEHRSTKVEDLEYRRSSRRLRISCRGCLWWCRGCVWCGFCVGDG